MIEIEPLRVEGFVEYGWVLGKERPLDDAAVAFSDASIAFREEHVFNPGFGGESQILWVVYRQTQREVMSLEVHRLCEQAVIPLTGGIIQIVATSHQDGTPDISSLRAFHVPVGKGICMRPGCWHTTRVGSSEVICAMFTRRSTTVDLIAHLSAESSLSESAIAVIDESLSLGAEGDRSIF
jgi:ureidoglycolate lyase